MKNIYVDILNRFKKINEKGWIRSVSNSTSSVGITFEHELNIRENKSFFPDYNNIEIKCIKDGSFYPIVLFSLSFDGPSSREIYRIVKKYGWPDKIYKDKNIINAMLSCKYEHLINNRYYFKLDVDKKEDKLYLIIYDINHVLLERISYINLKTINIRLNTKMKNLAIVTAIKKYDNGSYYFKYQNIDLYELKDFHTFIDLLETNIITANLAHKINHSEKHSGKPSSKNIVFSIKPTYIKYLFKKIN